MLNNLHDIAILARKKYREEFKSTDVILPEVFKEAFGTYLRNNSMDVSYSIYTATVTSSQNKIMYIPNQWFVAASYMVPYISEIIKYKNAAEEIVDGILANGKNKKEYFTYMKNGASDAAIEELRKSAKQYFRRQQSDHIDGDVENIVDFITDYEWWFGSKTVDRGDYYFSPVLYLLGLVNASQGYVAEIAYLLTTVPELTVTANDLAEGGKRISNSIDTRISANMCAHSVRATGGMNEIVYGAPGTGKSRYFEDKYGKAPLTRRVVFHPEYSYYDFVGVYKPVPVYKKSDEHFATVSGRETGRGEPYIDYCFVPGPFMKVLTEAWLDPQNMHTLLIEEINRADVAAVFGEVFQLLDRDVNGESEYAFEPSEDIKDFLCSIDGMEKYISSGIKIPSNMNIVATMNSADQGVKPMDTAFKRRWNFKYIKTDIKGTICENAVLVYAGRQVYWGRLIELINRKLSNGLLQIDEDKLIGPFFIKPEEIGKKRAIDKLLLYLWDDVLRHSRDSFFNSEVKNFADLSEGFEKSDVLDIFQDPAALNKLFVNVESVIDGEDVVEETETGNEE